MKNFLIYAFLICTVLPKHAEGVDKDRTISASEYHQKIIAVDWYTDSKWEGWVAVPGAQWSPDNRLDCKTIGMFSHIAFTQGNQPKGLKAIYFKNMGISTGAGTVLGLKIKLFHNYDSSDSDDSSGDVDMPEYIQSLLLRVGICTFYTKYQIDELYAERPAMGAGAGAAAAEHDELGGAAGTAPQVKKKTGWFKRKRGR